MNIQADKEGEYAGRYIAHWEVERVEIVVGRWLFGLLPRMEAWMPSFPQRFELPDQERYKEGWHRHPGRQFAIRFIGTPSEAGRFGHMGGCRRRVSIRQVLELTEVGRP
jgi:hypothetical protein